MSRSLTPGEVGLARAVFGEAIDYGRVRIATRPWGRPAITFGSLVTFPPVPKTPSDFSLEPLPMRAWFVHEMAHVAQFQARPAATFLSWLKTAITGGYVAGRGYRYHLPFGAWGRYNLEQQASMIEHAYVLREAGACAAAPEGAELAAYEACVPYSFSSSGKDVR